MVMKLAVFVVTTAAFTDRHAHIDRLLSESGFPFTYVLKYDADSLDENSRHQVSSNLSPKSASNVLKHLEAQRMFMRTSSDVALILEDDVIFYDNFADKLQKILESAENLRDGWLIFLGGADNKIDDRFLKAQSMTLIEKSMTTAEAYLVDRAGCEKRLVWVQRNRLDRQADHQLKLMDSIIGIKQFCVSHPIATQGSLTGLFKTTLDSSRAKHSSKVIGLRFRYNRLRRQLLPRFFWKLRKKDLC